MTLPLFPDVRLSNVARVIRQGAARWQELGVTRVRVFGSVARGEAGEASDIDLLVDFQPERAVGLLDLMRVKAVMEDLLKRRVDVLTEATLKHPLRREILEDSVDVMQCPCPCGTHTGRNAGAGACTTCWTPLTAWRSTRRA